jgi:hypothetical protein
LEFAFEGVDVFELAVDAGETDVGYFVEFFEGGHDVFADGFAADFLALIGPFFFEFIEEVGDLFDCDWAFAAGFPDAAFQLFAIVGFAGLVFFDYQEICEFWAFESGEAEIALIAGAAAADFSVFIGVAGIQNSRVIVFAFRAEHFWFCLGRFEYSWF